MRPLTIATLLVLATSTPVAAQLPSLDGLPAHAPINPSSIRRTGLFAAPYLAPSNGWRVGMSVEYGSAIEASPLREDGTRYLLDAELVRMQVDLARDLSDASFIALSLHAGGVHDGRIDGALDWFHDRVGFYMEGRESRPRNSYADSLVLADGRRVVHEKAPAYLGDARVMLGRRHGSRQQTLLSVTLPTSTGPTGTGRGVASLALIHTLRTRLSERWTYEGSLGVGYTPTHGELADVQRELLASASSGVRVRLWGSNSLYYYVFYHTPYYRGTSVPELEGKELSQDLGWATRTRDGREWRVGVTEDVVPDDQALDVVFKVSTGW